MKAIIYRLLLTISVISFSFCSLIAQKDLGDCNLVDYRISSGTCSSGFLEFTVTSTNTNSSATNTVAIEITFPGNRTVEKTGASPSTMTSMDATPIVFNLNNSLNDGESQTCTFRTMGCDSISVSFASTIAMCQMSTFPTQSVTFLNPVSVTDPCNCNDPQNIYNADGTVALFHDVLTFTGTSGDAILCTSNCSVILDNTGTPIDFGALALTIPVSGTLTHDFWRAPGPYSATNFTVGGITAILAAGNCDATVCNNNIPTIGEWGLIILSLFLVIFGIIAIKIPKTQLVRK